MTDPDLDRLAAGCKQPSHTQQDANNQAIHRAKQGQAGALSRGGKKAVAHLEAVQAVHRSRLPVAVIFIRVHVLSSKPAPEVRGVSWLGCTRLRSFVLRGLTQSQRPPLCLVYVRHRVSRPWCRRGGRTGRQEQARSARHQQDRQLQMKQASL